MIEKDFLIFLPVDISSLLYKQKYGIHEDERMPYYSNLKKWYNLYAFQICLGGSYVHTLNNIKFPDIVHQYFCVVNNGVYCGSGGAIYRQYMTVSDYDG